MDSRRKEIRQENGQIDLIAAAKMAGKELGKAWWFLLVLASLFASLFYFVMRRSYRPVYTAYASYIVSGDDVYGGNDTYDQKTAAQIGAVFPYILSSDVLRQLVCEKMGADQMPGTITSTVLEGTNLITVRASAADAGMACQLLEAVLACYPQVMEPVTGEISMSLMDESGIPQKPDNEPDFQRWAEKGMAAGILLGLCFMAGSVLLHGTVRNREEMQRKVGLRYLGTLPEVRRRKRRRYRKTGGKIFSSEFAGAAKRICTRAERLIKEKGIQVLLVTSAQAGEGKTTAACTIAIEMAKKGYDVLLVDADLRRPAVAGTMGLEKTEQGTYELFDGRCSTSECKRAVAAGDAKLSVITGTAVLYHTQQVLGDEKMETVMRQLRNEAELIILDAPPCGILSDAAMLAKYSDGCLFVVRQDYAAVRTIAAGMEEIAEENIVFLGGILNRI